MTEGKSRKLLVPLHRPQKLRKAPNNANFLPLDAPFDRLPEMSPPSIALFPPTAVDGGLNSCWAKHPEAKPGADRIPLLMIEDGKQMNTLRKDILLEIDTSLRESKIIQVENGEKQQQY